MYGDGPPKCLSCGHTGKNNGNYKGGITKLNNSIRTSLIYKKWIQSIFKRDKYMCQRCGQIGYELHCHHKKSFREIIKENSIITTISAMRCVELWDENNGITFCKKCHVNIIHRRNYFEEPRLCSHKTIIAT